MLIIILRLIVIAATAAACAIFIVSAARKFIGYNPAAPSAWARLKAWWPGFVKRHLVDDDPYDDETHAVARYYDKPTAEQIECARAASAEGRACGSVLSPTTNDAMPTGTLMRKMPSHA